MADAQPIDVERSFYRAFSELDLTAMRRVWSTGDDVYCIHPGSGLIQGPDAVMASWGDIFRNSQRPDIRYRLLQVTKDQQLVIHTVEETIRSGGSQREATVIATNGYRRDADGWHMLLHHASLPLVEPQATKRPAKPLH